MDGPYRAHYDTLIGQWRVTDEQGSDVLQLPMRCDQDLAEAVATSLNLGAAENQKRLLERMYANAGS